MENIPLDSHSPSSWIKKLVLIVLILLVLITLIFIGLVVWSNSLSKTNKITTTVATKEEINQQVWSLLTKSQIVFPKILKLLPVSVSSLSSKDEALILPEALGIQTNTILYDKSQTGFYITYTIASTTMYEVISKFGFFGEGGWKALGAGTITSLAAIQDMQTDSGDKAQVRLIQQNQNVQVMVKTLNKSK
jgi:hypothetical protein